ncbi:hypothetical protein LINPERPRIM_LOCUS31588 [Linum perenne]
MNKFVVWWFISLFFSASYISFSLAGGRGGPIWKHNMNDQTLFQGMKNMSPNKGKSSRTSGISLMVVRRVNREEEEDDYGDYNYNNPTPRMKKPERGIIPHSSFHP